jgi:hypothetical protein
VHPVLSRDERPEAVALARLRRALGHGHLWAAEDAARELPQVSLGDALRLVHLYGERDSPKFEAAALRWLHRYLDEADPSLRDVGDAVAQLVARDDVPADDYNAS